MPFFDMHTHLPSESSDLWRDWNRAAVLAEMDEVAVDKAVVMTLDGLAYDPERGNDIVHDACQDSGGRLVPVGSADPRRPDAARELERCAERGFRGIKLHPWMQGFSPLESYMTPVAQAAIATGLPFIIHDGTPPYASPLQIAMLAERFPELTVVLAHGGLFDLWEDSAAAANRLPNVHITMCGTASMEVFRCLIEAVPVAKLSMGTDGGFGDADLRRHRRAVQELILADLDPEDAAAIGHRNAERLLGYS